MPTREQTAAILAYHKTHVGDMQRLYDALRFNLVELRTQEQQIRDSIPTLVEGLVNLTEALDSDKTPSSITSNAPASLAADTQAAPQIAFNPNKAKEYTRLDTHRFKDIETLTTHAETYLREHHIDPTQDPLLQVLDAREILDLAAAYRQKYGQIAWDRTDYAIVTLAGCVGTLLELLLVKIPGNVRFLSSLPKGYALTTWLRKNFQRIQSDYLDPILELTQTARQPITTSASPAEEPKEPLNHKRQDALLAFLFGVLDIVRCTGTHVDPHGNVVQANRLSAADQQQHTIVIVKLLWRLFSEVFATLGLEPPFGSLRQEETIDWPAVAAYLHAHGYQPDQLLLRGIVPATIDLIVQGYWLLAHFDRQEDLDRTRVKLTSLLLLSHTLAASGHFLKTGIIFQFNPLLMNWEQLLRCATLLISWINEGIERENTLRAALDEEWIRLYKGLTDR